MARAWCSMFAPLEGSVPFGRCDDWRLKATQYIDFVYTNMYMTEAPPL